MMQKADDLILAILSETTAKAIVQKNIICEQLMCHFINSYREYHQ